MSKLEQIKALRESRTSSRGSQIASESGLPPARTTVLSAQASVPVGVAPGPRDSTSYQYRDPEKRRAYMAKYMKERRARLAADRAMK